MEDYKKMYEELKQEFNQYKKESIKWSVEDFTEYNHEEYTITEEQAQKALECMIRHCDSQFGLSWHDVSYWIEEFGTKK